ncbi:hypothetical protein GPECTOR_5g167 [Gonium pectorale]|uniref:Uncharacterized protein n=1 Tax=Gonium pectorale TaxID=33097 RepID=A0A150GW84_GONPE|nr:hypothetical protein GPECTOR_5g167 [Gonium pectorale]|eukprot:KXZ54059.1 hypothetical protein GPECTOR_5g167 [Gonium pectorale]
MAGSGGGGTAAAGGGRLVAAGGTLYAPSPQQQVFVLHPGGGGSADGQDGGDGARQIYGSGDGGSGAMYGDEYGGVEEEGDQLAGEEGGDVQEGGDEDEDGDDGGAVLVGSPAGSQDGRPAVAALPWLAPQVISFSQAHAASSEPLISRGQLLGRRVAFALVSAFRFMDPRAGEEVLQPGVYLGRVSEALGSGCQEDLCGPPEECRHAGEHQFFFVRVMTQVSCHRPGCRGASSGVGRPC